MHVVTRHPGRPRDADREAAILAVAVEVLGEVGYERLTIDAVASRARASKATVYRRWPGKAEMVVEALRCRALEDCHQFPDTGSLAGDLLALARLMSDTLQSEEGRLMSALMSAALRDPELAAMMRTQIMTDKGPAAQQVIDRAIARGESPVGTSGDLLVEVLPALLFFRSLVSGLPLDEPFSQHVVHDVLLPLLTRSSS